jgi:hypothetical protein
MGEIDQQEPPGEGCKNSKEKAVRGSRPGERRGGRQKGTPNKKTALNRAVIAAHAANETSSPLDVMLAVMRDPRVALADRVMMALKALPRLHRKPRAGEPGITISSGAAVKSIGPRKDAAGGEAHKGPVATNRDPINGASKKGPVAPNIAVPGECQSTNGRSAASTIGGAIASGAGTGIAALIIGLVKSQTASGRRGGKTANGDLVAGVDKSGAASPSPDRIEASLRFNRQGRAAASGTASTEENGNSADLMPLEFLLSVIGHPKTPAALQVKIVLATLPYTHPKQSSRPQKPAVIADRHGFEVDLNLAKKLRNKIARLAQLKRRRNLSPQDRKTIKRLHRETGVMMAALQCPCPSQYSDRDAANDRRRLEHLWRKRRSGAKLTPAEDGELTRVNARYTAFALGPEQRARMWLTELQEKHRKFRKAFGPRLKLRERARLRVLAMVYPPKLPEIGDPRGHEDFLAAQSAFNWGPADEAPSDFEEFLTDQARHDAAVEEMLAWRKAVATPD